MLDHHDIRRLLPQRYPMLLVDRVTRWQPAHSITAVKAVTGAEPCYRHIPDGAPAGHYAYPVPLLLESLGQTAALLWLADTGPVGDGRVLMFAGARGYRVTGPAYPGDVLEHSVTVTHTKADTVFAAGETWVGGRRIAAVDTLIAVSRAKSTVAPEAGAVRVPTAGTVSREGVS